MADMFTQMDQQSKKMIADVIFMTIGKPTISQSVLKLHYPFLGDTTINELLIMMQQLTIISKLPDGSYQVNPRKTGDIVPPVLWLLMTDGRYKKEEIEEKLSKLPPLEKKEVSGILQKGEYNWLDVNESPAPKDKPIAIRFKDVTKSYGETVDTIYVAEDMKIATFDGDKWHILPPFALYDYSPLSNKENINDGAIVTHWAEIEEKDLEGWNTRFDPIGKYKLLNIEADEDNKELVYKSLLWGASFIRQTIENNNNPESSGDLMKYYQVLSDLQYCMDSGKPLKNAEE